jgi:hypothetical protein
LKLSENHRLVSGKYGVLKVSIYNQAIVGARWVKTGLAAEVASYCLNAQAFSNS